MPSTKSTTKTSKAARQHFGDSGGIEGNAALRNVNPQQQRQPARRGRGRSLRAQEQNLVNIVEQVQPVDNDVPQALLNQENERNRTTPSTTTQSIGNTEFEQRLRALLTEYQNGGINNALTHNQHFIPLQQPQLI